MSDKKMKGTSCEPQSSSESNGSSYYSSSVHRQQRVPARCLKTKEDVSLLLCASAAQTLSSPYPSIPAQKWATQSRRNTGLGALREPGGTILMCALVRFGPKVFLLVSGLVHMDSPECSVNKTKLFPALLMFTFSSLSVTFCHLEC